MVKDQIIHLSAALRRSGGNQVRPKAGKGNDPEMDLEPRGVAVRRVGFRFRTDAELAAMHLVESEIDAERRPGASPQPLESCIAFDRHLPSQLDDHAWRAETSEGIPIGCSGCWSIRRSAKLTAD